MEREASTTPATWTVDQLTSAWRGHLEQLAEQPGTGLPLKRILFQVEDTPIYREIAEGWEALDGAARTAAWSRLLASIEEGTRELLPTCVMCGECCRHSSPTLGQEDLELLREEKLPWAELVTLREGEPARSPFTGEPFYLPEERIKVREQPGTSACVFLGANDECTIYADRPIQCRAQACWDPDAVRHIIEEPALTRREVFANVPPLLELIAEHDRRCSFERMRELFEELKESAGANIDAVIDLLAFDEHVRQFAVDQLPLPAEALGVLFGRPLAERVRLFGFTVEVAADGTRTLVPLAE
jgi:Fe-S-cluster containining protein